MEEMWAKVVITVVYLFITGVLWTVIMYCESVINTEYNDNLYFIEEVERVGSFISVKRLVIGLVILLAVALLLTKELKTAWLLLYGEAGILGLMLILTSVRVRKVLHLVSEYPGIPNTLATENNALIGCWGVLLVATAVIAYTIAVVFY